MGRKRQKNDPVKDKESSIAAAEATAAAQDSIPQEESGAAEDQVGHTETTEEPEEDLMPDPEVSEDYAPEASGEPEAAADGLSQEEMIDLLGEEPEEKDDREYQPKKEIPEADDESLKSFIREMITNFKIWVRKNRSFCIFTVIALALCISVIVIAGHIQRGKPSLQETVSEDAIPGSTGVQNSAIPLPPDPLAEDAVPEINELIGRYFTAMQTGDLDTFLSIRSYTDSIEKAKFEAKCEYIEAYENIHCYTKPGPYDSSYMVYVTYDLKLKDWEQPAPALVTLVVCTDQEGHLYIYSGGFDENVVDYIRGVTSQEDVYDLITRVQTEYQEVVDADAAFAEYMSALNQMIKDGVGVRLAAAAEQGIQPEDSVVPAAEPDTEEDGTSSENTAQEGSGNAVASFQVRTTATVNVRASDSENADKLGRAENGMELTCQEQLQNGWSKVIFEGKTGYIKSDYLVVVGAQTENGERATVVGKVMVMQSVNIRGSADMDGNVLGKAYPGTTFDVIARDWNGWTTILYNGKTAYIRTEYVEFSAN